MKNVRVTDARMPPFCWQDKAILRLIHESFKKSEIATALAIYATLTMFASNKQSDEFHLKRQTLCEFVGRSTNVVDDYLGRLADLGVIRKEPVAYDNMYRCMNFQLLPLPTGEVSLPTGTHPPAHNEASPDPQGNTSPPTGNRVRRISNSEESPSDSNAGPEAPQGEDPVGSEKAPPLVERGGGAAGGRGPGSGGGAGDLHSNEAFRSEAGGSGLILPGEEDDDRRRTRKGGKAKRTKGAFDLDRPAKEWRPREAVAYFQQRFKQKWNDVFMVEAGAKEGGQLKGLLAKLDIDGFGRGLMVEVIDHIFDHWDKGLPERLHWDKDHPNLSLICAPRWFETLAREVQNGVPKSRRKGKDTGPRHDEFNEDREKDQPSVGWGEK